MNWWKTYDRNTIAEGIKPQYKTRNIGIETGYWNVFGICDGCAKGDFLLVEKNSLRSITLRVSENGKTAQYCSSCSNEVLDKINREAKQLATYPEIDYKKMEQEVERRKNQLRNGG